MRQWFRYTVDGKSVMYAISLRVDDYDGLSSVVVDYVQFSVIVFNISCTSPWFISFAYSKNQSLFLLRFLFAPVFHTFNTSQLVRHSWIVWYFKKTPKRVSHHEQRMFSRIASLRKCSSTISKVDFLPYGFRSFALYFNSERDVKNINAEIYNLLRLKDSSEPLNCSIDSPSTHP